MTNSSTVLGRLYVLMFIAKRNLQKLSFLFNNALIYLHILIQLQVQNWKWAREGVYVKKRERERERGSERERIEIIRKQE